MQAERVGSLFWFAVGLISIYGSIKLGVGTPREPGSGFLSFLAGCFISLMATMVFLQSFLQRRELLVKLSALWEGVRWHRPLAIGLILVAYILTLEKIGFLITSFIALFILLKVVENLSWVKAILISVLASGVSYLIFNVCLKATLPRGILYF